MDKTLLEMDCMRVHEHTHLACWSGATERHNILGLDKLVFFKLRSTTQTLTKHAHSHPYEGTYTNPTPMSIFED